MKRFLLIAACAFLSLGFLTSCQKEETSVLDLARELTTELKTVVDHKSAEAAAPRVAALNKRLQQAMARPFAGGMNGSSLYRSCSKDAPNQEGTQLGEALSELAKEVGRVQASLPVDRSSDEDVSVPRLRLSVGACNGSAYTESTKARYAAAQKHIEGEEEPNTIPYPQGTPVCYGSDALKEALEIDKNKVTPSSVPFFKFDGEEDVVKTPATANPKPEDTEESDEGGEGASSSDGDETPSAGDDDETPSTSGDDDDDTTPTPAPADDDDSSDGGDDSSDSGDDSSDGGDDDGGLPSLDDDGGDVDMDLSI